MLSVAIWFGVLGVVGLSFLVYWVGALHSHPGFVSFYEAPVVFGLLVAYLATVAGLWLYLHVVGCTGCGRSLLAYTVASARIIDGCPRCGLGRDRRDGARS